MKALAVFPARREVRPNDHPEPAVSSPTGVKLRMLQGGVCGTDREIVGLQYGTPPPGSEYLVLGHESLGEVIEVGPAVTRVRPGDLGTFVARWPEAVRGLITGRYPIEEATDVLLGEPGGIKNVIHIA